VGGCKQACNLKTSGLWRSVSSLTILLSNGAQRRGAVVVGLSVCAVAESARGYVAAIQGLQQQLVAFALPAPASSRAALEQQAAALRQELDRAVRAEG
jgi:hypothetical protein